MQFNKIQKSHYVVITKIRLFIVSTHLIPSGILGSRVKNAGVSEEATDIITVKSDFSFRANLFKKIFKMKATHYELKAKVTYVEPCGI